MKHQLFELVHVSIFLDKIKMLCHQYQCPDKLIGGTRFLAIQYGFVAPLTSRLISRLLATDSND